MRHTKETIQKQLCHNKSDAKPFSKEAKDFIDYFLAEYERTQGQKFNLTAWGKYIAMVRPFVKLHGLESMKSKAHSYLISNDQWFQKNNYGLGLFLTDETINKL